MNNSNSQTKPGDPLNPKNDASKKGGSGDQARRDTKPAGKEGDVAGNQRQQQQGGTSPRPGSSRDRNG